MPRTLTPTQLVAFLKTLTPGQREFLEKPGQIWGKK